MTAPIAKTTPLATPASQQAWRHGFALWLLGMPGVVALAFSIQAEWLRHLTLVYSLPLARWVVGVGLSILLALAVAAGVTLGQRVGLGTPLVNIALQGRSPWRGIRFLSLPGLAGGIIGAAWLVTLVMFWPESLSVVDPVYSLPLLPKLLYGGITSELLLRYGVMSLVMWLLWRGFGHVQRRPGWLLGWWAVVITALLAGTLPVYLAWSLSATLSGAVLAQLLLCEIVYGLLAGLLFWRYGLEVAILAHVVTYLLSHGLV
ncbi:abortive infection protein [Comamonas testosteroni]|uniref:Abortive infection protein n=1 Tax=Comamonas testosteroni TaxID=285 RepID=A0A373FMT8_COMTE|nr:abortive infection protein [Comamonas testosteroni]RGE44805.1 abortive infection protein [Comamonas testosteroni]